MEASSFKEQWEAKKLLKRAKKKAKHALESQGYGIKESASKINQAMKNIMSNKPEKRVAGRGS